MILEIFYRGRIIKEVDLPNIEPKDVNYSIRVESKMKSRKEQPELPKVKRGEMEEGGGGRPRKPLIKLPEKEPVRFERVKGIYSNVKNYDNL